MLARSVALLFGVCVLSASALAAEPPLDFNRDIRSILSNNCLQCHGPDEAERKGGADGLRLDVRDAALQDLGGYAAIKPGKPEDSELWKRITSTDPDVMMPPPGHGKKLTPAEIQKLTDWIRQGANYAKHWSYEPPVRPVVPTVKQTAWPRNDVDRFLLARLEREGLTPQPETDRYALIRRLSLDLTGLPPSWEDAQKFANDTRPEADAELVDRLLMQPSYGEHWARLWLDLARYADSAGYADDPARTIWAYRDYVIRSFNQNLPFDQFTIEQIAGDLLPNPTEDQRIATAFHRNTLTNNEGGTNDEEFRNVAVVDRVNTTLAVWMGTTINCAQCHSHKYDPITQEEFFKLFAFFNQSEDADRTAETPVYEIWSPEQLKSKAEWPLEIAELQRVLTTPTPALLASQAKWEAELPQTLPWQTPRPTQATSQAGVELAIQEDGAVRAARGEKTDVYTLDLPITAASKLTALRLEVLPDDALPGKGPGFAGGNFVLSKVTASVVPPSGTKLAGRFVRISIPGPQKILSLAEVQIFQGTDNLALKGKATQSTTDYAGPPEYAIDGNTSGNHADKTVTHTAISADPWWEVDLQTTQPIDRIVLWNRTDGGVEARLSNFQIAILDENRQTIFEQKIADPPKPTAEYSLSGVRGVAFSSAFADFAQSSFDAAAVLDNKDPANKGWAVGPQIGQPHVLTLTTASPLELPAGSTLQVRLEQISKHEQHVLGRFRLSFTDAPEAGRLARIPAPVLAALQQPAAERTADEQSQITAYYLTMAPELQPQRDQLAKRQKQLAELKPFTTVPVMQDLPADKRRKTQLQRRGNFQDLAQEVTEGVPAVLHPLPEGEPVNRLALAKWLIDRRNPLTARVVVNRLWEQIFGTGIVATSEEFGSQGELPVHPELLDWLAVELMDSGWNLQHVLKLLVSSAAYRQSSFLTEELAQLDPENRLLARGPRFRMSAEMIRDQALAVSGLLSGKMYGPPVKPFQPKLGVNAAFGSGIDWQTSDGEDKHRRALYTTWRRSNPYPSMAAFDAPNREVCTLRRTRTNTPLQALVTLNDPVYLEAAQALSRRVIRVEGSPADKAAAAIQWTLTRPATDIERTRLAQLFDTARTRLAAAPENAKKIATMPIGPVPEGVDVVDLAAWTVVMNAVLNLDELFMRR